MTNKLIFCAAYQYIILLVKIKVSPISLIMRGFNELL